jgi:xanthine/uracil/vitamin C permease (AzgA family)
VITYTVVKTAAGKYREVSLVMWILTLLFLLRNFYLAAV